MKTILVVEDFSYVRRAICKTLHRKGYLTVDASTGQEAYRVLAKSPSKINLVLSDTNIPEYTGFDLLKTMKQNPELENVSVAFMDTDSHSGNMKITGAGLIPFMEKPSGERKFFAEIDRAINTKGAIINIVS